MKMEVERRDLEGMKTLRYEELGENEKA